MSKSHPRRSRRGGTVVLAGCLVFVAVACAETKASAPAPVTAGAGKEVAWADMSKDQRIEYMKSVVVPQMKQVFTTFNPDRYGKMGCMTCHGDGATDGSFKMPNPKLPVLPNSSDGFKQLAMDKPAIMEFMKTEVKPKMAALLGMPEWTPDKKTGFGCGECHTTAQ